jgi:lysylphosphatidylglycerol synthase-like protein
MARRLYDGGVSDTRSKRQVTVAGLLIAAVGTALFVWLVWTVGPGEIWTGFQKIGWGLVAIVVLGGLRFAVRAAAWTLCIEPPHRLGFMPAFTAVICGDAVGNVTPFGPLVSEPTKIACVRGHVAIAPALTALAIENVIYALSVAAMIAAGAAGLLFSVELPLRLRQFNEIAVGSIAAMFVVAAWVLWRRPSAVSTLLPVTRVTASRIEKLRAVEHQVLTFASRRRGAMVPLVGLELVFHGLGVIEKHLTLWLILGSPPSLLTSFIVETADRLITVGFKFVPFQVGVGEAGTGLVTLLLGLGEATGVTVSIVRKARMGIWSLVGTGLLVHRGLTPRQVLADRSLTPDPSPSDR